MAKLTKKSWDADTDRYHFREDSARDRQTANKIAMAINQLLHRTRVPGMDKSLFEIAHEQGSLSAVVKATDPVVKRAYFQFRSKLEQFMDTLETSEKNAFYKIHGQNPLDWGFVKVSKVVPRSRYASRMFRKKADQFDIIPLADMRKRFDHPMGDNRGPEEDHKEQEARESKISLLKKAEQSCAQCGKPMPGSRPVQKGYERMLVCKDCANKVDFEAEKSFKAKKDKKAAEAEVNAVMEILSDPGLDKLIDKFGHDNKKLSDAIFEAYFGKYPAANFNEVVDNVIDQLDTKVEVAASLNPLNEKVYSPDPESYEGHHYGGRPFEQFHPGDRVQVDSKGGYDSSRKGVVVDPKYIDRVPKPKGEYGVTNRPFDPQWEAVILDDKGNYFTMYHSRLDKIARHKIKQANTITESDVDRLKDTAFLWREGIEDPLHRFAVNGLQFDDEKHKEEVEDAIQDSIMTVQRGRDIHTEDQLQDLLDLMDYASIASIKTANKLKARI